MAARVAAARARAERETYDRIAHLRTPARRVELDQLLVTDPQIGMTRLRWLSTGPTEASATAVKTEVKKLEFLRGLDANVVDLSGLPAERRRHLAAVGRRSADPDPGSALAWVDTELHAALGGLEQILAGGQGPVRVDEHGELVIGPLSAEDVPAEAAQLRDERPTCCRSHRSRRCSSSWIGVPGSWTVSPTPGAPPRGLASSSATCWR